MIGIPIETVIPEMKPRKEVVTPEPKVDGPSNPQITNEARLRAQRPPPGASAKILFEVTRQAGRGRRR